MKTEFLILSIFFIVQITSFAQEDLTYLTEQINKTSSKAEKNKWIYEFVDTIQFHQCKRSFDSNLRCHHFKKEYITILKKERKYAQKERQNKLESHILLALSRIAHSHDKYDKSLQYAEEVFALATSSKDTLTIIKSLLEKGHAYKYNQQYDAAEETYQKGLQLSITQGNLKQEAVASYYLGVIFKKKRDLVARLKQIPKTANLFLSIGDVRYTSLVRYRQAQCFSRESEHVKSLQYFNLALEALPATTEKQYQINEQKSQILFTIGGSYFSRHNLDSSLYYSLNALDYIKNSPDTSYYDFVTCEIGDIYYNMGNLEMALQYYQRSLELTKESNTPYNTIWADARIGLIYSEMGYYKKALPKLIKFIDASQKKKEEYNESLFSIHLAQVYLHLKDYPKALSLIERSMLANENLNHPPLKIKANGLKSEIYLGQKNYIKAEQALNTALDLAIHLKPEFNYKYSLSFIYNKFGILEIEKKQLQKALEYFQKALKSAKKLGLKKEITQAYYQIGHVQQQQNLPNQAIQTYLTSLEYANDVTYTTFFKDIYKGLADTHAAIGRYTKAYEYQVKFQEAQDNLLLEQQKREINELESQFFIKEKENENKLLQNEKVISQVSIQRRNILAISLFLVAILISMIAFILQRANKKEKKQNEFLEHQVEKRTQELLSSNAELAEIKQRQLLEEAKSRFFANVSHEFRTPLTLIQAPIEKLLKNKTLDNKSANLLQRALRNSKNLMRLVTDILDIGKLETEKVDLNQTSQVFYLLIRRVIANFETYAQSKSIVLKLEYRPLTDLQIEIDKEKFEKILNNYISNALKFTPTGGNITVLIEDLKNRLKIAVIDTGKGIPSNELSAIFERYYQVKSPNDDAPLGQVNHYAGGTGIGLSLCKDYAELFEGKVWAKSPNNDTGEGSTFYFEFPKKEFFKPLSDEDANMLNNQKDLIAPLVTSLNDDSDYISKNNTTILIVEDNYDLRSFLKELLEEEYHIITAENGKDALNKLKNSPCELIISDVMMPIMDGFELLEQLKSNEKYRHIPVMMLTARAEMKDKLKALRIGVDDYMLKPFHEEELKTRVKNLILNVLSRQAITMEITATDDENIIPEHSKVDIEFLLELERIVNQEFTKPNFKANDLVDLLFLSRSQLFRNVKRLTGLTVNQYIKEVRMQTARQLLENQNVQSVKELAYSVGFKHTNYFSQSYEQRFGKRPSEYL